MALYDFGNDVNIGFVLAYFRSFAVPQISNALLASGEITHSPGKRSTDIGIVVYEIITHGFDSERGRTLVSLLRRVHAGVPGTDDDFLYVLISLLIAPLRWLDSHGWRAVEPTERAAAHRFFFELGQRIGLETIPTSFNEAAVFFDDYEALHVAPSAAGIARTTSALPAFTTRLPHLVRRWDREILGALIGDVRVSAALGLPTPSRGLTAAVHALLKVRNLRTAHSAPLELPIFTSGAATTIYPSGYRLSEIGPPESRR
ncbi:oxygenase MpaB family protein [Cryobacterium sp. Y57]|uniref:oxygenase MpaB family protein n=1 Tax=Cryobacterium sp. Y57 TaxID=2048287 RepID=UPI0013048847|nr:oxygenase MpaB family protein [Cryobacterium sp. Y57]